MCSSHISTSTCNVSLTGVLSRHTPDVGLATVWWIMMQSSSNPTYIYHGEAQLLKAEEWARNPRWLYYSATHHRYLQSPQLGQTIVDSFQAVNYNENKFAAWADISRVTGLKTYRRASIPSSLTVCEHATAAGDIKHWGHSTSCRCLTVDLLDPVGQMKAIAIDTTTFWSSFLDGHEADVFELPMSECVMKMIINLWHERIPAAEQI